MKKIIFIGLMLSFTTSLFGAPTVIKWKDVLGATTSTNITKKIATNESRSFTRSATNTLSGQMISTISATNQTNRNRDLIQDQKFATNTRVYTAISTTNQRHYADDLKFATNTIIRTYVDTSTNVIHWVTRTNYTTNLITYASIYRTNNTGTGFTPAQYPSFTKWTNVGNKELFNTNCIVYTNNLRSLKIRPAGAGYYICHFSLSGSYPNNTVDLYGAIAVNGVIRWETVIRTYAPTSTVFYNISGMDTIRLNSDDTIALYVAQGATTRVLTIGLATMYIIRIR